MKPGDLVRIKGKGQFAKEAVAIGILIEFDKVEPDGGWIVMIGDRIETFVTTWWDCEVVDEDR
jgi:hypothetical protein